MCFDIALPLICWSEKQISEQFRTIAGESGYGDRASVSIPQACASQLESFLLPQTLTEATAHHRKIACDAGALLNFREPSEFFAQ
jgi:hypothetical protein